MSAASAVPALIDRLVTIANAAYPSMGAVQVFDGVGNTQQDTGSQLWIGVQPNSPDDTSLPESAVSTQVWPYASGTFRRETLSVHCVAQCWTGDSDQSTVKTMRDAVYAIVQTFTTAVVADPTLTGAVWEVSEPLAASALYQTQDDNGTLARVSFDVNAMHQFQG